MCVCMRVWEQHGSVVVVLGSQSKGCEFEFHLSFAVQLCVSKIEIRAETSCPVQSQGGPGWTSGANTTLGVLSVCSCKYLGSSINANTLAFNACI